MQGIKTKKIKNFQNQLYKIPIYNNKMLFNELSQQNKKLNVYRASLPQHKSGMVDQAKAFLAYFRY